MLHMRAPVEIIDDVPKVLSGVAYFQGMKQDALERVSANSRVMPLRRDDTLVDHQIPGDPNVYVVLEGQIHLGLPTTDTIRSLRFIDPGMTLGESVLLMRVPPPYLAVATRKSRVLVLDGNRWLEEIQSAPDLSWNVLKHLAQRRLDVMHLLVASSRRTDLSRVAGYIAEFRPKIPSPSFSFELPARKLDIAANLGMSNASFSRALQHLKNAGFISVAGSCIHVLDLEMVEHVAQAHDR